MTRQDATEFLRDSLDKHNLSDWHVRLTNDLNKPFLGLCSYKDKCIILNAHHIDIHPTEEVVDTILHEVAHAIMGSEHGHDVEWANKAKEIGCTNTLPCSHLSLNPDIIAGADVKIEFETEVQTISRPKYTITRLQDKCEWCSAVAEEVSSSLVEMPYPHPHKKFILLKCGHTLVKSIPQGTPFHLLISNNDLPYVNECKHIWDKNQCTLCKQYKPYAFQLDGMKFGEQALNVNKGVLIADEMGLGKEQSVDAIVYTIDGPKRMGDITLDDLIVSDDGLPYKVKGIYPQGVKQVYKIHFSDGTTTECGEEHLWNINTPMRKYRNQPFLTKKLIDFKDDLQLRGTSNYKWFIPITKPVQFTECEVNIDPYQLGILLGDGCFTQHQITFHSVDEEIVNKFETIRNNENDYFLDHSYLFRIRTLGLEGTKSDTKFIPNQYIYNSIKIRLELLRGLMDSDGSIWKNGVIEYATVSPHLARGVLELVQSLGGTARLTTKEEPKYIYKGEELIGKLCYRIVISLNINPFRLSRKANQWKPREKYNPTRAITRVIPIGHKECQCIAIDSPSHLYLTDDYIVTHNTIQALGLVKYCLTGPTLYIVKSGLKFQWSKQILIWLGPEYVPQIIESSNDYVIPNLRSYIIGYDMLVAKTRKSSLGKTIKSGFDITKLDFIKNIILDECQQIKNPDSSRTQQVRKLAKDRIVIPLSGTPWKNKGSEFFSALNMIAPVKFPSYAGFKRQWVETIWDGNKSKEGGIRNIPAFKDYCADVVIRRERVEVMSELPLINRMKLYCNLDTIQQQSYNDEVSAFVKWYNQYLIDGTEDQINSLDVLAKLARMRHITGLAKIPQTIDFVNTFLDETERKLVVFVHHKDVGSIIYDELSKEYPKLIFKLTADMSGEQRFKIQEQFNATDKCILIGSTLAMGEGLNLQTCADCVMHERQWNPANEEQAEGRFIRIGQQHANVNATYVEAEGTVDEILDGIIERKRVMFHESMNNSQLGGWNQGDIVKEVAESIVKKFNQMNKAKTAKLVKVG